MAYQFSPQDLLQIEEHGLTPEQIQTQIDRFHEGFPRLQLDGPATLSRGIIRLSEDELEALQKEYDASSASCTKFVPASGAATRLFKRLYAHLDKPTQGNPLKASLAHYPFAPMVADFLAGSGQQVDELEEKGDYAPIVRAIVDPQALGLAVRPKALIPFHRQEDGTTRTPIEEHLVEGALYARRQDGTVHIHFTVSPQHEASIRAHAMAVVSSLEQRYGVKYHLGFSLQSPSTDTIAARLDGSPYRDTAGRFVFRPAGHGALLENLSVLEGELVFIKNIDNVAPDRLKAQEATGSLQHAGRAGW
ncbi:MAG: hypothetical protein CSA97_02600 [Bacteroidetes bacterium]|nr:MAG: hypothetical protein CSA97_02600 [Bacteroidota bacterium]